MNIIIKRTTGLIITVLLILSGLNYLTDLVERKSSDDKYGSFFEETKDYDVLFMGTSHVINAFFPMELWYDHGITSYNFGGHSNTMAVNYWVMKNALEYSSPEVMIIDCLDVMGTEKTSPFSFDYVHLSMDAFPMTHTKRDTIKDLVLDNKLVKNSHIWDLWWDFSVYHDRWKGLEESDFVPIHGVEKGAEARINVAIPDKPVPSANACEVNEQNIGVNYLCKMIEECQEREISVLLTYLPFPAAEDKWEEANLIDKIAEEYEIKYINFLNLDVVDYQTDCCDENSHLNPSGARKITDYLGKYLKENYALTDHRYDNEYNNWNEDYISYKMKKTKDLKEQISLDNYLMLLEDRHFDCTIKIRSQSEILRDERMINLIANLSLQDDQDIYHELTNCNESCSLIKKDGELVISHENIFPPSCASDVIINVYDCENQQLEDTASFSISNSKFISAIRIDEQGHQ